MILNDRSKIREKLIYIDLPAGQERDFFAALFEDFGCVVESDPGRAKLIFARTGEKELCLSRVIGDRVDATFPLPIELEELYASFQEMCYFPFRKHLRSVVNVPAVLTLPFGELNVEIQSLSIRGARIVLQTELVKDQAFTINFTLDGADCVCSGKVIYNIDWEGTGHAATFEAGLVFTTSDTPRTGRIRDRVYRDLLVRLQAKTPSETFRKGLDCFDLSADLCNYFSR